jgi:Arc-like DNA binding domain
MARKSTKAARKPTDTVQLKLRFSEGLRRQLARQAKQRDCSLNAEIVARLEQSLKSESLYDAPLSTVMARTLFDGLDEAVLHELVMLFLTQKTDPLEVARLAGELMLSRKGQK